MNDLLQPSAASMAEVAPSRHLLCSIGINNYQEAAYRLGDHTWQTRFAPVAVARLLGLNGASATVLVTSKAHDRWYEQIALELRQCEVAPAPLLMPDGMAEEDVISTVQRLVEVVGEGEHVVLDVSFALRHLPFAYFTALTYLTAQRGVSLGGIYNGAYDLGSDRGDGVREVPLIDLSSLFRLVRWYHAVQTANDSGDMRPLQRAFDEEMRAEKQATRARSPLESVGNALNDLASKLAAGLPLEAGLAARRVLEQLDAVGFEAGPGIALRSLQPFKERLSVWAVRSGIKGRADIRLDDDELRRQLRMIRWYAAGGNLGQSLLLLREWLVTRALFEMGDRVKWLGYGNRKPFENALNAAAERARSLKVKTGVGSLWNAIRDERDPLAHGDTDDKGVFPEANKVQRWIDECEALLDGSLELRPPGEDVILLTPLGLTPGVLFTAVLRVRPDQVIAITSREAETSTHEALAAAGMQQLPREVRVLSDPFAGIAEARQLARKLLPKLAEAREVVVNLTGGTTAMQLTVEEVAQHADRLGIPIRRVFLIDRRPVEQQKRNPYVLGELVDLSPPSPGVARMEADAGAAGSVEG